ncbi:MAG: neutral zinc metallopeptidase [Microcystaceae cyanobacterium]
MQSRYTIKHFVKSLRTSGKIPTILAIAAIISVFSKPTLAAWNYQTLKEVEQQLNLFLETLPNGETVKPPRVFVYEGVAMTPCGKVGVPAYCPGDNTIYLEVKLLEMANSAIGDYAAYAVLAHEYGHSYMVQTKTHPLAKDGELKADEFAGVFTRYAQQKNLLEAGDVDEALKFAFASGDHAYWDKGHHGTPAEREQAFRLGLTGNSETFTFKGPENPEPPNEPTRTAEPKSPTNPSPNNDNSQKVTRRFSKSVLWIPVLLLLLPLIGFGLYQLLREDE